MQFAGINITTLPRVYQVSRYVDPDYNFTDWKPDGLNLVMVKEGVSEFRVSNGCQFTASPGDFVAAVPNFRYSWKTGNGYHSHIGLFVPEYTNFDILDEEDLLQNKRLLDFDEVDALDNGYAVLPFHMGPDMEMEREMNALYMEQESRKVCAPLAMSSIFLNLLVSITRRSMDRIADEKAGFMPAYNYIYTKTVMEYVNANYSKMLDVDNLAKSLGLSRDYMCTVFRKTTKSTLTEYVNRLRINKAKELLLSSGCRINEICRAVGIANEYYFSRLFRKFAGVTPKQYRRTFSPSGMTEMTGR